MAMITYPLNNVQYKAEDAELYNAVRISGVWSGSAFDADVTGNDTIVTVGEGLAWIANTKFSGKVVAQKEPKTVDLGAADPSYNRIDVIAIQFDSVENKTDIIVKKGVASSSLEMPERSTTESLYELYLYSVLRTAGSSIISKSNITDLRDNRNYCGYMQDAIKPGYAPSLMEHNNGEDFRFWFGKKEEYEAQKGEMEPNMCCVVIDEKDIADYPIECGKSGIWNFEKWKSGKAICYGNYPYKFTTGEMGYVGKHYYVSKSIDLPSGLFKAAPPVGQITNNLPFCVTTYSSYHSTAEKAKITISTDVEYGTGNSVDIMMEFIGSWK